jgi:hypothetical protein
VSVANPQLPPVHSLTQEELTALLGHSDLLEDGADDKHYEERGRPIPPNFRERLALGDISW